MRAHLLASLIVTLTATAARVATATPFVPTDDGQVLERLPVSPLDSSARELQALRHDLAAQPGNLGLATRAAWRYIEQGRGLSDPRYYGYAQAALAPWWELAQPPVPVLVLRATIRQHDHDFDSALSDLSRALQVDPENGQAWLTRALILQVRGDYAEAKQSCLQVFQVSDPLVAVACVSAMGSLSGAAQKSADMLRRALDQAIAPEARVRLWILTLLAEIAARTGQPQAAEERFAQALALKLHDDYLLGAYADFLLDENRPESVVAVLANETRTDALLLRLAIAEQRISAPAADGHVQALRARFAAGRARGSVVHRREEARFALYCLQAPHDALALARENWNVQHEPWDARVLLESALAAGEPAAAQPVLDFLAQTGLEDVRLAHVTAQLHRLQP